jgi:methionyl aminopeptidase
MLRLGQTIAVEVMAAMGDAELVLDADGWTYRTKDGSWTAMVEETVVVGERGGVVLT